MRRKPLAKAVGGLLRSQARLISLLCLLCSEAAASPRDVLVFADFACTKRAYGDPDDCLAVTALHRSKAASLVAIVATGGNAPADLSMRLVRQLFPDVATVQGSKPRANRHSKDMMELARVITSRKGKMDVLVLSPATDFAAMLRTCHACLKKIRTVTFVAGRMAGGRFVVKAGRPAVRDMNYAKDRRSMKEAIVLLHASGIPMSFIGFRAAMNATIPTRHQMPSTVPSAQQSWARKTRFWFGRALPPFDLVATLQFLGVDLGLMCQPVRLQLGRILTVHPSAHTNIRYCE